MYSIQKQDFIGNWIEVFHTQPSQDADVLNEWLTKGPAKLTTRIIPIL